MKKVLNKFVIWLLIIVLTFNTSLSYAATYKFKEGTNTITVQQYKSGVTFTVDKTGVYSINILPVIEGYVWKYKITTNNGKILSLAAYKKDGIVNGTNDVYELYSKDIVYLVLKEDTEYKIKGTGPLIDNNSEEKFVTLKLGTALIDESGKYYEAKNGNALDKIDSGKFQYENYRSGHEQGGNTEGVEVTGVAGSEAKVSLLQQLLTSFFVKTLGDGAMFLIGVVAGEPITIDKILFNEYSRTRLAFFTNDVYDANNQPNPDKINPFLSESGILPDSANGDSGILNKFFNRFTYIAIVAYLIILLYMGIRIILTSTGKNMAKYKKLFVDWILGILILFLFPYVIRYTIRINDAIVGYIGVLRQGVSIEEAEIIDYPGGLAFPFSYVGSDAAASQDYMSQMRTKALETGQLMYALCWFLMIKQLVAFLIIYIKRMLTTMFLIVIFPLVTISYAIDKIGDGRSQAFNNWVKEYILNVFLQTFHAINYVVVMGIVFAVGRSGTNVNFILIIIGISYLSQGDRIMRGIFSQMKGGGGNTVKDVAESMLATKGAMEVLKNSARTIGNGFKNLGKLSEKRLEKNDRVSKVREYEAKQKWDSFSLGGVGAVAGASGAGGATTPAARAATEVAVASDIKMALGSGATTEQLQKALGQLRSYSMAGGDAQSIYEREVARLSPERRQELEDLMEQNDAVEAMENVELLTEAEINANLSVLIKNRKKKGNYAKLGRILESRGITEKKLTELSRAVQRREISAGGKQEFDRLRGVICTREDAAKINRIQQLDEQARQIREKNADKRARIDEHIEGINRKLNNRRLSTVDRRNYEQQIARLEAKKAQISDTLSLEDRKALLRISEERQEIVESMTNPNAKLSPTAASYSKMNQVNKYLDSARVANGTNLTLTDEQKKVADAQAVLDGSDSGQYTLTEIWEANETIREARRHSTDSGVAAIIRAADSNPETRKSKEFTTQLAATIVKNEGALSGNGAEKREIVSEAKKRIVEVEGETGIYQHILDEAGVKIETSKDGVKSVGRLKKADAVKEVVHEILEAEEEQLKQNAKEYGDVITGEESLAKMKRQIVQDRLDLTRGNIKAAVTPVATTIVGLGTAGMYAGAASELAPEKLIGATALGAGVAKTVTDKAVDFTMNRVENVTNIASGIATTAEKGESSTTKTLSTILYGDDNEQGVETRNIVIKTEKAPDPLTQEEEFRKKRLEERKAAVERVTQMRNRFVDGIANATPRQSSSTGSFGRSSRPRTASGASRTNRPLTQAERNRLIFTQFGNNGNNNGNNGRNS